MTNFINIITFIAEKYGTIIPTSFLVFFTEYCLGSNTLTDIYIFKFYINNNTLFDADEQKEMLQIYIKSKKIKRVFKKYNYLKKIKKYNISNIDHDLYFSPFSKYPKNQLLEIIENKTIYTFRISNLINMWVDALSQQENLFSNPIQLKNPYTNLPFLKHNLYNIFFSIKNSNFYIHELIYNFFLVDFNIDSFIFNNYPMLKEHVIKNYINQSSSLELYESIHNMLCKYKTYLNGVYLPDYISYSRKKIVIKDFIKFLPTYLISEYSCNPLKKRVMDNKVKIELKKFIDQNEVTYLRTEPILALDYIPPPPPFNAPAPPSIEINIPSMQSMSSINLPPSNNTRLSIRGRSISQTLNTTNSNTSRLHLLTETQAFNPVDELPRTPQRNTNVQPYRLNLFNST